MDFAVLDIIIPSPSMYTPYPYLMSSVRKRAQQFRNFSSGEALDSRFRRG